MVKKVKISEGIFFFSLGIYIVLSIVNTSLFARYVPGLYKAGLYFSLVVLLIREFQNKMSKKRFFVWLVTLVIIFISVIGQSGANTILTILFFSAASSDIDFDRIATFTYKLLVSCTLLVISASMVGIIDDYVYVMAGQPRHYLGFLYALQPAGIMFEIMALNLYLHRDKEKNRQLWLLLLGSIFVFAMTKARLTFVLQILMIVFYFLYRHKEKWTRNTVLATLEKYSYVIAVFFSFYFALTFEGSAWKQLLNLALGNRLYYSKLSLDNYGVGLLGQNITWAGMGLSQNGQRTLESVWSGYDWVDNAYVQIFQLYGIIVAVFFILALTFALHELVKNKRNYLAFIISVYAVYGIIDTAPNTLLYNIFWLAVFKALITRYQEHRVNPLFENRKIIIG